MLDRNYIRDGHDQKFYINGQWVAPLGAERLDVINPASEEVLGQIPLGTAEDVDVAVAAARAAFKSFGQTSVAERKALLDRLLAVYISRAEDLAQAVSEELGAPIDFSRSDQVSAGNWHLEGFIKGMDLIEWDGEIHNGDRIRREPIGVVGAITPWNWPLNQLALKCFAAIGAGCTVVLKPSEVTPYNAVIFAEIMDEAGVPAGVFNMIQGLGPVVGSAMSRHKGIDMMSFTGSTRAGGMVSADAAATIKRVALELGGKSPNIVFADADLEKAVRKGVAHMMDNTGQSCNAPSRMIVERAVYDQAVAIAADEANKTRVIKPSEPDYGLGPLVSEVQFDRVQELIQSGIDEGARLVAGGPGRPEGFNRGYYSRPTVFADVSQDMRIWREEIFGPVLVMAPFEGLEEAIVLANDTPYGLSSYVQTQSAEKAEAMARGIRAGMVRVNGTSLAQGSPFGGYGQSGIGREGGVDGLSDFLEVKVITRPKDLIA